MILGGDSASRSGLKVVPSAEKGDGRPAGKGIGQVPSERKGSQRPARYLVRAATDILGLPWRTLVMVIVIVLVQSPNYYSQVRGARVGEAEVQMETMLHCMMDLSTRQNIQSKRRIVETAFHLILFDVHHVTSFADLPRILQ